MKLLGKIVGIVLVLSLGAATSSLVAMKNGDSGETNTQILETPNGRGVPDEELSSNPCPSFQGIKTSARLKAHDIKLFMGQKAGLFNKWFCEVQKTSQYWWLTRVIGASAALYLLDFLWTGALLYCATGDVDIVNAWTVCPLVSRINWISGSIVAILAPYVNGLIESAVAFQQRVNQAWYTNERIDQIEENFNTKLDQAVEQIRQFEEMLQSSCSGGNLKLVADLVEQFNQEVAAVVNATLNGTNVNATLNGTNRPDDNTGMVVVPSRNL